MNIVTVEEFYNWYTDVIENITDVSEEELHSLMSKYYNYKEAIANNEEQRIINDLYNNLMACVDQLNEKYAIDDDYSRQQKVSNI